MVNNSVTFRLGTYNPALPLIIDPYLVFASYSGSSADNWGYTATYDRYGNLYGGGIAFASGYPTTVGAYQVNYAGGSCDIAISKFNASGSNLLYSTYLGGIYSDMPHSLIVNDADELYIYGTTGSNNFPVSDNAFDTTFNGGGYIVCSNNIEFPQGSDIFIARLSANGTQLLNSTYVGGTGNDGLNYAPSLRKNYADDARGEILVDEQSNVYVISSTYSSNFPVTADAFQPVKEQEQDAVVFKMAPTLDHMIWGSFLGGSSNDAGYSIELAADYSLYCCGGTQSSDFPITPNAYQITYGGGTADGFIARISQNGTAIEACTFLGYNNYDQVYFIKKDVTGNPCVFGQTIASGMTWIYNAQWYIPGGGQFITKLLPDLSDRIWSTAFGSSSTGPDISPTAFMTDYCKNIYLSGWGSYNLNGFGGTTGLPVTPDAIQDVTNGSNYYFLVIAQDASQLIYATFFGGMTTTAREHVDGGTSRFDNKGNIYQAVCAGCGRHNDFPTTPGAWSESNNSLNCNLGVIKINFSLPAVVGDFIIPELVCAPADVEFINNSQTVGNSATYWWDFGDGTTSDEAHPTHHYATTGEYAVTLIVTDIESCNYTDTVRRTLIIVSTEEGTLPAIDICRGDAVQIGIPPSSDTNASYQWTPAQDLSSASSSNPYASPTTTTTYALTVTVGLCIGRFTQTVNVHYIDYEILDKDTAICLHDSVLLHINVSFNEAVSYSWSLSPDFSNLLNTSNNPDITVSPTQTATYYWQAQTGHCSVSGKTTIKISIEIKSLDDLAICHGEPAKLRLQYVSSGACSFNWSPEEEILSGAHTATPLVNPMQSTQYTVIVTAENGCTDTADCYVTVHPKLLPDTIEAWADEYAIIAGSTVQLHATSLYGQNVSYLWSPESSLDNSIAINPIATPSQTTIYTVTFTDINGCSKSDTVLIRVSHLDCSEPFVYIPNAFTPNNDGTNDQFRLRSKIIETMLLRVYDRWGELLFETTRLDEGWDGTFRGQPCDPGVYVFYVEAVCISKQPFIKKGNVTLMR
jgi:gliding motility-associated-like protein